AAASQAHESVPAVIGRRIALGRRAGLGQRGHCDTAFRVFILMASRRLKSDRYIAQGFNADVFTAEGGAWVNDNSMLSVLHRHHPELAPALYGLKNAFVPWRDVFA